LTCLAAPGLAYPTQTTCTTCFDTLDNDSDSDIDCLDADCEEVAGCWNAEVDANDAGCDDGIDNDGDSLIDCADITDCCFYNGPGQACENAIECAGGTGETDCGDGVDNDGDNDVDCFDSDCVNDAACTGGADEAGNCVAGGVNCAECGDGIDNDNDGDIDCDDTDCATATAECPPEPIEGDIDCHDPNIAACLECYDGIDNDTDGTSGNVSGYTGAAVPNSSGIITWDPSAPIANGADCHDPQSVACYNDMQAGGTGTCTTACAEDPNCPAWAYNCYILRSGDSNGRQCVY
jgi:hypothetical protein